MLSVNHDLVCHFLRDFIWTLVAVCAVSLLRNLKHANIVTLHDIIHTNQSLTIVFEYLVCTHVATVCVLVFFSAVL